MDINFRNSNTYTNYLTSLNVWNTWTPSVRVGPTGIGATWEAVNKVEENNDQGADLNGLELKAKREHTNSRLTLFCANPVDRMSGSAVGRLVEEFGKPHRKRPDERSLHKTMRMSKAIKIVNGEGVAHHLTLVRLDDRLALHGEHGEIAAWPFMALEVGLQKIETLSLAWANVRKQDGVEFFRYHTLDYYQGLDLDGLMGAVERGDIVIDLRASFKENGLRDRGTAFRIAPKRLGDLYQTHTRFNARLECSLLDTHELEHVRELQLERKRVGCVWKEKEL